LYFFNDIEGAVKDEGDHGAFGWGVACYAIAAGA